MDQQDDSSEIVAWPERALFPDILYLRVGDDIPAAAAPTVDGWTVVIFGAETEPLRFADEAAVRAWMSQWQVAA